MIISGKFRRTRDKITITIKFNTYKFCKQCGYRIRGETRYIRQHYSKHHRGLQPEWLQYGEMPTECCYDNFDDYLRDPEVVPELRPGARCYEPGRPKSPEKRHNG